MLPCTKISNYLYACDIAPRRRILDKNGVAVYGVFDKCSCHSDLGVVVLYTSFALSTASIDFPQVQRT